MFIRWIYGTMWDDTIRSGISRVITRKISHFGCPEEREHDVFTSRIEENIFNKFLLVSFAPLSLLPAIRARAGSRDNARRDYRNKQPFLCSTRRDYTLSRNLDG